MDTNTSNAADVNLLVKAWQSDSLDARRQAAAQLDKLGAWTAVRNCVSVINCWKSDSELESLIMPSESFIKESLQSRIQSDAIANGSVSDPLEQLQGVDASIQASCLRKHTLLHVGISGRSFNKYAGLYAYDGARLIHLNGPHAKEHLSEILRSETFKLDEIEPIWLTDLLCRSLLPLSRLGYSLRGHLVVQPSAALEQESAVAVPEVQVTKDGGWKLHFWTEFWWGGCTARTPLLFEHTVEFSPEFEITFEPPDPDTVDGAD